MPTVIDVQHLTKTYEFYRKQPGLLESFKSLFRREKLFTHAVNDISFSVAEGELVGFLGPNGAGKTTTLKVLSGILYPSSGEVRVLGFTPWKREHAYQKQFSIVMGQKNQLWWDLPAMDSFLLNKEIYEVPKRNFDATIEELSVLLEVTPLLDVQVRKLSLGERMKMELIAALIHQPKILFLDEPTIGLDVVSQQKVREFIKAYNTTKRTTILLTSHYMDDVEQLCERVIIINKGIIAYDGNLRRLVDAYVDHKVITVTFTKSVARADVERFGTLQSHDPARAVLAVPKGSSREVSAQILTHLPVDDILISEVPIEEVVRKIFQSSEIKEQ